MKDVTGSLEKIGMETDQIKVYTHICIYIHRERQRQEDVGQRETEKKANNKANGAKC